ncbi:lipopolysaccharide biosynthesis protein [Proteus sp. NMG38-2]|uniref:lipopolysaccharide biosynthesis protein n=1 Tax=Proteus sp. NMG38-2 TaxID=2883107 RepID=UPI001D0AF9A8|nr:lipopolysaccharide biosynthesis protein [Proteus sp. NMG38-2]UDN36154.1 lipopolysaccharide biosynthesis protein [Proteus sp. NMG38-2]
MNDLQQKTTNSLKWSAIERLSTQAVQLSVMLILGRMLGPVAFGLIGMLAIFIAISQTLVDSGFSNALIRKKIKTESDYSTTFYFNIFISFLCYTTLYISAPYIADFYKQPQLEILTKVQGLIVIINAFSMIQRTKLIINMNFKTQAKASLISVLLSSILSIFTAYLGFGVWALIIQTLSFSILNTILLNIYSPWLPKKTFSKRSFKYLFSFGSKLLLSNLIDTIYNNIYQIIIGRIFSASQLGLFSQAKNLSYIPAMTLTSVIQRVTYPMLSHINNSNKNFDSIYLLTLKLTATIVFPLLMGLAIISQPLISIILGENWSYAATLLSILCVGYMLYPIHAINLNLLQVKGRSDLFLKLEIIKKLIVTAVLIVTVPLGLEAICIGIVAQSYLALLINTYYTGKLTSINIKKQCKSIFPIWLITIICSLLSWGLSINIENIHAKLIFILTITPLIYVISIRIFQYELFNIIISNLFKKKI